MTDVISSIFAVFTAIIEWFVTAMSSVSAIFYNSESGLTFVGTVSVIGFSIAVVLLVIAMIRSLLKGRG